MTDFNKDARYDKIRELQNANRYRDIDRGELNSVPVAGIVLCISLLAAGAVGGYMMKKDVKVVHGGVNEIRCDVCHKSKMVEYFQKIGSPQPEKMAAAVLATKRPRLMAAIAKVESNGNPAVKRTGYKKLHDGAFQVNRRIWGNVSDDALEQAIQAEMVLDEHRKDTKNLKAALNGYGGDKTKRRYASNVLRELQEVPE